MFRRILVANRGEIAARILTTARALGYETVAVYSSVDAGARHLSLADEAVCIGPPSSAQSYLSVEALLAAARATGADAIHPGYGFLSENADFAEACAKAGIHFIGPSPEAIRLMGSKRLSKLAMIEAGVPCIPGYEGAAQDNDALIAAAQAIGFPLMIKASAGGGGRGMRLALNGLDLAAQLDSARLEATNAFGSGELILERALLQPRHIELQIFGDQHGQVIHLGERDCSIQRRHQKVVEEAPSPFVTPELRQRMGQAAVEAARACGYVGAGTVEFLVDGHGAFYFLEMNTRLQVEHPVTELVTGIDLVAWQLRIAAGAPLPLTQEQIELTGHAIEVRLYAEDPAAGFLPQTGSIERFRPATVTGLRIDHGIVEGGTVSPYYDPMLAKLIAWGKDREEARRRLLLGLTQSSLLGITTNKQFLAHILRHPSFVTGNATTAFIGHDFAADSTMIPVALDAETIAIAATLFCLRHSLQKDGPLTPAGWSNAPTIPIPLRLSCQQQRLQPLVRMNQGAMEIEQDGEQSRLLPLRLDDERFHYRYHGVDRHCHYLFDGPERLYLDRLNGNLLFEDLASQPSKGAHEQGSGQVAASTGGAVISLTVAIGSRVTAGEVVLLLEAMKMEHRIKAAIDGVVSAILVKPGDQVKQRQLLLTITPDQSN